MNQMKYKRKPMSVKASPKTVSVSVEGFRRVTIKDVARQAGVSRITAARILSGNPNYPASKKSTERVRNTARELHYQPNPFAQSLGRRRSHIIGLCVHQDSTIRERLAHAEYLVHLDPIIAGINTHPQADRYSIIIVRRDDTDPDLETSLRTKLRYLDGLIYITPCLSHRRILVRISEHLPLVLETAPDLQNLNTVSVDEHKVIRDAVQLLVEWGCRTLGLITWGTRAICVNDSRCKAFRKVLGEWDLPLGKSQIASRESGFETQGVMSEMLRRVPELDGVIVAQQWARLDAPIEPDAARHQYYSHFSRQHSVTEELRA